MLGKESIRVNNITGLLIIHGQWRKLNPDINQRCIGDFKHRAIQRLKKIQHATLLREHFSRVLKIPADVFLLHQALVLQTTFSQHNILIKN